MSRPARPTAEQLASWDLDPAWSRLVDDRWHVLDTGQTISGDPEGTIVCVHGNPTWGYAWATFLHELGDRYRVIAIDQLNMGYSAREGARRYAQRVTDLDEIVDLLDIDATKPVYLAAHDWGGAITLGWMVHHRADAPFNVAGLVLCNTGIAIPDGRGAPKLIRLAAAGPLRDLACRRTPLFVEGAAGLSLGRIGSTDRAAFRAPYRRAEWRTAVSEFVGDVPFDDSHPSAAAIGQVADRLGEIDVPVLLAWGSADPVFNDDFAADLAARLPDTTLHRFPTASHLVMAEADVAGVVSDWLDRRPVPSREQPVVRRGLFGFEHDRANGQHRRVAVADAATGERISFDEFAERVEAAAAALVRSGLQRGDRVAMLVPPGVELLVAVYAVWRAGGVTVVADRGLGAMGLRRAVNGSRPQWILGDRTTTAVAKLLRFAPQAQTVRVDRDDWSAAPGTTRMPDEPALDDEIAVLFTSGATGPAKGVRYRYGQLLAQRDALMSAYDITADDRFVAAFVPFALYGPAMGIGVALPDCDVTRPGTLTADALDDAVSMIDATMVFASPAALKNVSATASAGHSWSSLRLVLSAGAPVPVDTLRAMSALAPRADLATPYGMTEALPVASITLTELDVISGTYGVCVGSPVAGAEVMIDGEQAGGGGEILVRSPWLSDGYDSLWATQHRARPTIDGRVWHRSGDVGHFDDDGRLWVEGRVVHVIRTADGAVSPLPIERRLTERLGRRSAAVAIGPAGTQQLVVVLEGGRKGLADERDAALVREALEVPVAAVLEIKRLPVDIRHNAKIDRTGLARWAERLLR